MKRNPLTSEDKLILTDILKVLITEKEVKLGDKHTEERILEIYNKLADQIGI